MCTLITACLSLATAMLQAQPVSDFAVDAEGWNTVGMCPAESSPGAVWSASGGYPSGAAIKATDNSIGVFYWYGGGAEWKGDLSAYYGCYLFFDLKTNNIGAPVGTKYDVLIIRGDDETISYEATPNPALTWTSYVVPLSETGWIVDGPLDVDDCPDLSGPAATAADMLDYLGDIKRLRIRAEYGGLSSETNWLDNVEISCEPLVLPVELADFEAFEMNRGKSTYSENNALGFQIEKSHTGEVFDSIGFVPAAGFSNETLSYQFVDNYFTESAYYRLKQVKFNYRAFYSDVVLLEPTLFDNNAVQIYPNPGNAFINFAINDLQSSDVWEICDITGKQVISGDVSTNEGAFLFSLDVSSWKSGIYIFKLHSKAGPIVRKFEVLK
jgi:hypothetical protein